MFRVNYIRESNIKKFVHNNGNILKQRKFIFTLKNFRLQHGRERKSNLSGNKERHDILRFGRERIFLSGQPEVDAYAARLDLFHRRQKIGFFAETAGFCGWFRFGKTEFSFAYSEVARKYRRKRFADRRGCVRGGWEKDG